MSRRYVSPAIAILMLLAVLPGLPADDSPPIVAFLGLSTGEGGVSTAELRVLENRLTGALTQVAEQHGYSVTIPRDRGGILEILLGAAAQPASSLGRELSAYAAIGGELNRVADSLFLDIRTVLVEGAELLSVYSGEFGGFQEALAAAQDVVSSILDDDFHNRVQPGTQRTIAESEASTIQSDVSYSDIVGTWNGDRGLGVVEIRSDGRAVAGLNGSGSMRLSVRVEGNRIIVQQDEPNAPKMYMPVFPYTVAVQIVDLARPMRWTFTLNSTGDRLTGIKDTTFFQVDQGRVVWADNTHSRQAVWTRRD